MLAVALTLLGAGAAQAATVRVGPSLEPATGGTVGSDLQVTLANLDPASTASPVSGTVIDWSIRTSTADTVVPRILRPTGPDRINFTGISSGPPADTTAGGVISGPFPLSLPIAAGDAFGIDTTATAPITIRAYSVPGGAFGLAFPKIADGATGELVRNPSELHLAISATVRYCAVPSLKGKSPSAARAALLAADCTPGAFTKSKKRTKKPRVLSQGVAAGTSVSDTQPIPVKVSRKAKKKRR